MVVNLSLDHHVVPTNLLEMPYVPVVVAVLMQLKEISTAQSLGLYTQTLGSMYMFLLIILLLCGEFYQLFDIYAKLLTINPFYCLVIANHFYIYNWRLVNFNFILTSIYRCNMTSFVMFD